MKSVRNSSGSPTVMFTRFAISDGNQIGVGKALRDGNLIRWRVCLQEKCDAGALRHGTSFPAGCSNRLLHRTALWSLVFQVRKFSGDEKFSLLAAGPRNALLPTLRRALEGACASPLLTAPHRSSPRSSARGLLYKE